MSVSPDDDRETDADAGAPATPGRHGPASVIARGVTAFGRFWWDFLVGETPELLVGSGVAVGVAALLVHSGRPAGGGGRRPARPRRRRSGPVDHPGPGPGPEGWPRGTGAVTLHVGLPAPFCILRSRAEQPHVVSEAHQRRSALTMNLRCRH